SHSWGASLDRLLELHKVYPGGGTGRDTADCLSRTGRTTVTGASARPGCRIELRPLREVFTAPEVEREQGLRAGLHRMRHIRRMVDHSAGQPLTPALIPM